MNQTNHKAVYNLNGDQQRAADEFLEFLFDPDAKEFNISGPAGVGKTYLMEYISQETMQRYHNMSKMLGVNPIYTEVVMTATTNKAAEVLSKAVKRDTQTIHSFMNLTVKDDYKSGTQVLQKTNNWKIHVGKIIFVDEGSMVDTELHLIINEGTQNCKIVYVGDHNQLAPVGEIRSPIYKGNIPMVELLKPMRNANQPALMAICQQLRGTVETLNFQPIQIVPGVIDLLNGPQMQAEIDRVFAQQTYNERILAYTNARVIQYNDHIRNNVRGLPASFIKGEYLVTNSIIHTRHGQVPLETEVEVLKNHGADKIMVDEEHNVWLDVDVLDLLRPDGTIVHGAKFATNRPHYDELMKYYARVKQWRKMFSIKNALADLRPRDAATVHKSQGSTYDTVFVDLENISTCRFPNQAARMLYVAFSRARSRVVLYGNLAEKFGGLVR